MSEEIIKVIDHLGEKFGVVIDWSSQNVMPAVEELCGKYINYEIGTSVAWLIIIGIVLIAAIVGIIYSVREYEEGLLVFFVVAIVTLVAGMAVQIMDIIQCNVFPEMKLLEFARWLKEGF